MCRPSTKRRGCAPVDRSDRGRPVHPTQGSIRGFVYDGATMRGLALSDFAQRRSDVRGVLRGAPESAPLVRSLPRLLAITPPYPVLARKWAAAIPAQLPAERRSASPRRRSEGRLRHLAAGLEYAAPGIAGGSRRLRLHASRVLTLVDSDRARIRPGSQSMGPRSGSLIFGCAEPLDGRVELIERV